MSHKSLITLVLCFLSLTLIFPAAAQEMAEETLDGGYSLLIPDDWSFEREDGGDEGYYYFNDEIELYVLGPVELAAVIEPEADASAEDALNLLVDEWLGEDFEVEGIDSLEDEAFEVAYWDYTDEDDDGNELEGTWYLIRLEDGSFALMDFIGEPEVVYAQDELVLDIVYSLYPAEESSEEDSAVEEDAEAVSGDDAEMIEEMLDGGYTMLIPADWSFEREVGGDAGYYYFSDDMELYVLGPVELAAVIEPEADASAEDALNLLVDELLGEDFEVEGIDSFEDEGFEVAYWDYADEDDDGENPLEGTWYLIKLEDGSFALMDFYGEPGVVFEQDELVLGIVYSLYPVE